MRINAGGSGNFARYSTIAEDGSLSNLGDDARAPPKRTL
jgi:hypothetical protein